MINRITGYQLYIIDEPTHKDYSHCRKIADTIREINEQRTNPLIESPNGQLVIAIGGDGTFLKAMRETSFSKEAIYVGIPSGTLSFLLDTKEKDLYDILEKRDLEQKLLPTRKLRLAKIEVFLRNGSTQSYLACNEVLIGGENYSKIKFAQYINNELFHTVCGCAICISTPTGDTGLSKSAGGAIDFSKNPSLQSILLLPISNRIYNNFCNYPLKFDSTKIKLEPSNNIIVKIDGDVKDICSKDIDYVEVSLLEDINILDLYGHSKLSTTIDKFGYT